MPFRIPKPQYDEDVVLAIEEYLDQKHMTQIVHISGAVDGLRTTYHVGGGASDGQVYKQPLLKVVLDSSEYPTTPWRGRGCDMCDNWAYTHQCYLHETTGPLPLRTADRRATHLTFEDALKVFHARLGPERESTDFYGPLERAQGTFESTADHVQRAREIVFGSGGRFQPLPPIEEREQRRYIANDALRYSMEISTAPELTEVQSPQVTYRDIEESIRLYWGGPA